MKKWFAVLLLLLLAAGMRSALAEQSEYARYTHPEWGYSLEYPVSWQVIDDNLEVQNLVSGGDLNSSLAKNAKEKKTVVFCAPYGNVINVAKEEVQGRMGEAQMLSQLQELDQMFQLVYAKYNTLIEPTYREENGYAYAIFGYELVDQGDELRGIYVHILKDTHMYSLTMTSGVDEQKFSDSVHVMDHMLETFQDREEEFVQYTHPAMKYTLSYPAGWMTIDYENIDQAIEYLSNSASGNGSAIAGTLTRQRSSIMEDHITYLLNVEQYNTLIVASYDENTKIEDTAVEEFSADLRDNLSGQLPDCEIVQDVSWVNLNGRKVCVFDIAYMVATVKSYMRYYTFAEGTRVYCVSGSYAGVSSDAALGNWIKTADQVVGSFTK